MTPPIVTVPDPRLRQVAVDVVDLGEARALAASMQAALARAGGIGLAAPQVGAGLRLVLVHPDPEGARRAPGMLEPRVLLNPTVTWRSPDLSTREEGCLSIPGGRWSVTRPRAVRVAYVRPDGTDASWEAEDLVAACLQHEIDHLDGKLVIDGLSRVRRDMVVRRVAKEARA